MKLMIFFVYKKINLKYIYEAWTDDQQVWPRNGGPMASVNNIQVL